VTEKRDQPAIASAEPRHASRLKRALGVLLPVAFLVVVFGVVFPELIDYGAVLESIKNLTWWEVVVLFVLALVRLVPPSFVDLVFLPRLGFRRTFQTYVGSQALLVVVPYPGDLVARFAIYRSYGVEPERANAVIWVGGSVGYAGRFAFPVLVGLILLVTGHTAPEQAGTAAALVGVGLFVLALGSYVCVRVLRSGAFARRVGRLLQRLWAPVARRFHRDPHADLPDRVDEFRTMGGRTLVARRWTLVSALLLTYVAEWVLLLASTRFVGIPADELGAIEVLAGTAVFVFISAVPLPASGVGVTEAAIIGTLSAFATGATTDEIAAAVFVYRAFSFLLPVPLGLAALGVWRLELRRMGQTAPDLAEPAR
jgi:uncharacterized membrane protein YbhN (UPF0104 family)